MPLDPSIFMQYAALKADQNKQLLGSINSGLDSAYKNKALKIEQDKAKTAGFDLDKLAAPALIKMQLDPNSLTPEDTAILKAWDLSETRKLAPDATGNYRKINASIFGGMPNSPSGAPQGFDLGNVAPIPSVEPMPSSFIGGTNDVVEPAAAPAIPLSVSDLQPTGDPNMDAYRAKMFEMNQGMVGDALPPVAPKMSGFDTELVAPQREPITVPPELEGNPNAKQKYLESAAAAEGSLATDVKKSLAIKEGESALTKQQKITSIDGALGQMADILKIAENTPSGTLESLAAKAANKAGFPTKKSNAQADFAPRVTLLTTQVKNFIRSPGEGTFTDADQALLNSMLPEEDDSVPTKITKLKAIQEEFQRIKDRQSGEKSTTNRGFKYLGTE